MSVSETVAARGHVNGRGPQGVSRSGRDEGAKLRKFQKLI